MRPALCGTAAAVLFLFQLLAVAAQDSGPAPGPGEASKQYSVVVLRAASFDQGTLTFQRSAEESPTNNSNSTGSSTSASNSLNNQPGTVSTNTNVPDQSVPANGNIRSADTTTPAGNATSMNPPGSTTTTTTPGTSNSGTTTTGMSSSGTTTGTTATSSTEPASYWTRARANGQVASQTSNTSSPDYWTRARVNGEEPAGASTGNVIDDGSNQQAQVIASGSFTADIGEELTVGTWYSFDLGNFSLWYATSISADGDVTFAGYATSESIVGRTSVGASSFLEALFTGSFFFGQANDSDTPADSIQTGS